MTKKKKLNKNIQGPLKRLYVKSIHLDNFKSFKENSKINLAPMVNLIFGQNSAGKSSIFQALRLFRQSYSPGNNMSILNYESPLEYRGKGGLDIDIGFEGIVNDKKINKYIDLGLEVGSYQQSKNETDTRAELKFRFKYLPNFYKGKDLIKNKTVPSKVNFSDSKNFVSIDLVKHKFFKENDKNYNNLIEPQAPFRRLSRRFKIIPKEKSPFGAIYDPFFFKAKINKKETRLSEINNIYNAVKEVDKNKIYKILEISVVKFKKIINKRRSIKKTEPISNYGKRRVRLKEIKKKMQKDFYGKKLKPEQRLDWFLNNVKEFEKENEGLEFDGQKGDAIDVLNEEYIDLIPFLGEKREIDGFVKKLKKTISFLSKNFNEKDFYDFFIDDIIEENKDLIFFNGDFKTDPSKNKKDTFYLAQENEDSSKYIINILGWLLLNDTDSSRWGERYVNLLGIYDSSNTVYPTKDAMSDIDIIMKKMIIVPGLRSMPKRYFVKGMQTNYVGAQAENLAELLANPKIKNEANNWLKKLEIPYDIDIRSSGNYYEIVFKPNKSNIDVAQTHVGLGYPLIMPLIVQSLISRNNIIVVEEPEVHLHPKIEADIAELIVYSSINFNNQFLIETHSEEFLLRILKNVRNNKIKPENISINYITNDRLKGKNKGSIINKVLVKSDGSYKTPWKDDLFAERMKEFT